MKQNGNKAEIKAESMESMLDTLYDGSKGYNAKTEKAIETLAKEWGINMFEVTWEKGMCVLTGATKFFAKAVEERIKERIKQNKPL